MPDRPTIRKAEHSDAADIARISRLARATAMPWLPVLHSAEGDLSFFSRSVLREQQVEIATMGGETIGFIAHQDAWINHLYIHPNHWRTGCGSTLLLRALQGAAFRQLWVFERNHAAQVFYARHGFHVAERTDGAKNEERCPDVRMEWRYGSPKAP